MYKVLNKDTIENEIIPYLFVVKRGFKTKIYSVEIVNCILYKLKIRVQWSFIPLESFLSEVVLSYKTVFGCFRKWCKKGDWQDSWSQILSNNVAGNHHDLHNIEGSLEKLFMALKLSDY